MSMTLTTGARHLHVGRTEVDLVRFIGKRTESIHIQGPRIRKRWISVGFLAVWDALGKGLGAQPELQQDDSMAYVQGSRAAGRGRVCVPGELNEPQHQQPGDEKYTPGFVQFLGPSMVMALG